MAAGCCGGRVAVRVDGFVEPVVGFVMPTVDLVVELVVEFMVPVVELQSEGARFSNYWRRRICGVGKMC